MDNATTLPGMLVESCFRWSAKPAMLHKVKGEYKPVTYDELLHRVHQAAAGLTTAGIGPGMSVAIMAENSPEWAILDWAALSLGAVVVPIYPTLMPEAIGYMLRDACVKVAFAGDSKLGKKLNESATACGLDTLVITIHGHPGELTLNRLIEDGKADGPSFEAWKAGCGKVGADDLATIIYTSGTTGEPKGAELTHRAFTFLCNAIIANLPVDHHDRFFSFLPLSHVYERMAGHFLPISTGAEIAYADSLRTLSHDIVSAQPTIVLAVPRFLDSVRSKVLTAGHDSAGLKRKLFFMALERGPERLRNNLRPVGLFGGLLDTLVGRRVRDRFGGRIRFFVSGGAALPHDLAEFYAAFGLLVLQGYGLTETAPVISVNHPARNRPDSVGEIVPGIEVRIADDGEILMRGPSLMRGYHSKPKESAEAIDSDGWFHTGDIGTMEAKRLRITDRKKDIIVMANGKNVAPLSIENRLKSCAYVDEAMAIGDGMDYIAALILPSFEALRHFCHQRGIDATRHADIVEHPEIKQLMRREVEEVNRSLADFEKVKRYEMLSEPWTQETGELTPTLKVRRAFVREKYADLIQSLKER